ncbi:MAG: nucleotidyltransferase domain-containing protein, partial [Nitrospirae bacterium]
MAIKQRWAKTKPINFSTDEALDRVLPILKADFRILIIYLFGSRASMKNPKESDLDLAIYT